MTTTQRGARIAVALALGAIVVLLAWGVVRATGGVYTSTKHGDPSTGVERLTTEPRGDCAQCHDQHASRDGQATTGPFPYALFAPDDNDLCATSGCHNAATASGIYAGPTVYDQSSHKTSSAMVWPGPTPRMRDTGDAGYCVNCHTPHGRADASGLIPSLATVREEDSCDTCHDATGPAMADIATEITKAYRHPIATWSGRHVASEATAAEFGTTNRHAECVDCHNPHDVRADTLAPTKPIASNRNQRVSRVQVVNGTAGTVPTYTFLPATDAGQVREYEVCFKCHSSWTTRPAGQPDTALEFNTNNPSFHPVEGQGRNANIDPNAFVNGWTWDALTYCSDCHGSDSGMLRGPHGSNNRYLLKGPYTATSAPRIMTSDEICFTCHRYDTYANEDADPALLASSRFNPPGERRGHAYHVQRRERPCYSCHASHGSTTHPALIVIGRNPGLVSYTQTTDGGTCTPTCHNSKTYTINYAR